MHTDTGLRKERRKIKRHSGVRRQITRKIHFVQQTSGKHEYRRLSKDLIIILTNILDLQNFFFETNRIYKFLCVCVYVCICVYIYIYVCIYVYMYMYMYMCIYIYIYIYCVSVVSISLK